MNWKNLIKQNENQHNSFHILDPKEESILERNMTWIFGMHRSGTTWLAKQLLSHQTLVWNEPIIGHILGNYRLQRVINGVLIEPKKIFPKEDFFFEKQYKDVWLYFLRKLILGRAFAQFQEITKKLVIKEPNGSIGADMISESLPKSKIIIVIRDCRDIVDSRVDGTMKGGYRSKLLGWSISEQNRTDFIREESEEIVKTWEVLDRAYENHPSELRFKVKYENLLKNTYKEISKIYNFLGIDIEEDVLNEIITKSDFKKIPEENRGKGKIIRSATPGKWKENFNEEEKELMKSILGDTLKKLGYMSPFF